MFSYFIFLDKFCYINCLFHYFLSYLCRKFFLLFTYYITFFLILLIIFLFFYFIIFSSIFSLLFYRWSTCPCTPPQCCQTHHGNGQHHDRREEHWLEWDQKGHKEGWFYCYCGKFWSIVYYTETGERIWFVLIPLIFLLF